ncbi:uncharacterized protein LOC62_04G005797 [Vanrija pseudolonga]|uniref:Uncharacterized protein n=1 Tax=Vanrija pseudolonga TaxID=143232 RepID=A0AAF1BRK1_9TREE|nr:hypothetical protein LOC62_04G005797 [Vanrija pseudolonga]
MSSSTSQVDITVVATPSTASADQSLSNQADNKSTTTSPAIEDSTPADTSLPLIECSPGEHPPSSMSSSTPYSVKSTSSMKIVDDPFHTPGNTESSGDVSFTTPSTGPDSTSSTSLEIFLGPQPLSYIHHRRRLLAAEMESSPSRQKPGDLGSLPLTGHSKVPAAVTHAEDSEDTLRPLSTHPTAQTTEDTSHLSQWRQEQLKKAKPIRPVAGARERPIPLLHGPLSLPYARNPSGVDATVSDQNTYMANIFGVRAVESTDDKPEKKVSKQPRESNTQGSRNVSSSSYYSVSSGVMSDSSAATGSSRRPLIIRDYHQIIGIKKEGAPRLVAPVSGGEFPSSFQHEAHHQVMQHVDLRSHLGVGYPYAHDYIQQTAPVMPSPDYAIHSASGAMWPLPTEGLGVPGFPYSPLQLVDPNTKTVYSFQIPGNIATEAKTAYHHPQLFPSKAETSINWRNKVPNNTPVKYPVSPVQSKPTKPSATASPMPSGGNLAEVLTVDHLYKRFGQHALRPLNENISHLPPKPYMADKAPEHEAYVEPTKPTESPVKTLPDASRKVSVQEETPVKTSSRRKGRGLGSSRNSINNGRAKGTPGAGKFLKHSVTDDEGSPSKATPSDTLSATSSPKRGGSARPHAGRRHPVAA